MKEIANVYNDHKSQMLVYANSKRWVKIGMDADYMKMIVEDVLLVVCNSKQAKIGFTDKEHIRKYIWNVLRSRIRLAYAVMVRKAIPELTVAEKMQQFKLAKEIIDKNRPLKANT